MPDSEQSGGGVDARVTVDSGNSDVRCPPWHARKEAFIARIAHEPVEAKLVCAADKLHNAQTLVRDLRLHGPRTLDRFRGGREGTLWYYRALVIEYTKADENALVQELDRVVTELERLAGVDR